MEKGTDNKGKISSYGIMIDKDRLLEFSKISIEGRLQWLEEANEFLRLVATPELRERWNMFRNKTS